MSELPGDLPRLEEICLPPSVSADYTAAGPFNSLIGLRRLNVLVGPNNSGKSRLMRSLFLAKTSLVVSNDLDAYRELRRLVSDTIDEFGVDDPESEVVQSIISKIREAAPGYHPLSMQLGEVSRAASQLENEQRNLQDKLARTQIPYGRANALRQQYGLLLSLVQRQSRQTQPGNDLKRSFSDAEFVYVPTLRGMRLGHSSDKLSYAYFDRTWLDYVRTEDSKKEISEQEWEVRESK